MALPEKLIHKIHEVYLQVITTETYKPIKQKWISFANYIRCYYFLKDKE